MRPKKIPLNATMHAVMTRELLAGPCTAQELADETGMRPETVRLHIRALRAAGIMHVQQWVPDSIGRLTTASYRLGEGQDVKRRPMLEVEIKRRYRARSRQRAMHDAIMGAQS